VQVNSADRFTPADGPSVRIPVDVRRFPWIRRLAADYAFDFRSVAPFFSGDPSDRSAWADAIARTQAHERRRAEIAAVIAAQQEHRQAPPAAREAGRLLADRRTVAIVTGQQAGLFGGPLFTLLKALTALKLAEQVSRDHGVPAVAIFWIDAEDHDWEEVRSCTVFDDALTPRSVALPPRPGAEPSPVATIRLDETIHDCLAQLEQSLPATEFRGPLMAALRRAYTPGAGMADAFGRWLEDVLGARGLVVYDSSDPASKPLVSQVFARELSMPGQTVKLAALAGSDLTARGYHAQVHAQDDSLALFHLDGGRRAIRQQDGRFLVGDQQFPAATLVEQATERPAGFSPNVLLRPVVQDTIFPTVCYVAGPNELAYLGQLRGVYQHFAVPMPLFYPRASATLLDSAAVRFLTKYKLPLEALQAQDEAALNELLKTQIPPVVEESFSSAAQAIDVQMARLIQTIPALDPTLEGAARSTLERMQRDLLTLQGKMIQAAKRRDETLRRQFMHAHALAFPGGHAQERTIGFVSFLNEYGSALVDRLDEELPLDLGHHWIVTI
jgi:bacillithiol synthase